MIVKFNLLNEEAKKPERQTEGSVGYDLYSNIHLNILPSESGMVTLGFSMEIEPGYEAQIRSRSGLAFKKKVFVLNSPGTIDPDYRGEVGVLLMNLSKDVFTVKKGDRIAQMIFSKVYFPDISTVDFLNSSNRKGGWGSTKV